MREIESKEKPSPVEEDILVTLEVVYEFYLRGFTFEHMDLYRSHAVNFLPDNEKGSLLPPFTSVPGLGETAAWSIMEQREGKRFISIEEFSAACPKVSKTHIEQLKAAGALDACRIRVRLPCSTDCFNRHARPLPVASERAAGKTSMAGAEL